MQHKFSVCNHSAFRITKNRLLLFDKWLFSGNNRLLLFVPRLGTNAQRFGMNVSRRWNSVSGLGSNAIEPLN